MMIDMKEITLKHMIYKVQEQAKSLQAAQLFSWTKEISSVDMLTVFQNAKQLKKDRTFWMNSDNDFALIGIGQADTLIAYQDRFTEIERQWNELKENAFIYNKYNLAGTGLVSLGGMSFDPLRERSSLWEKYPPSQLTIPEVTIANSDGRYFLTYNHYCYPEDDVENTVHKIEAIENTLLYPKCIKNYPIGQIVASHVVAPEQWKQTVVQAVNEIKKDRAKKIVLAREMRITLNRQANITDMLRKLIHTQPNSYIFAFEQGDNCFIGATPERLVQVEKEKLLSTCLAGTAPRGETRERDAQIAREELLENAKNREEHEYVVQMIKQSIEDSCEHIDIPEAPVIYPLRNLQHLYTPVKAILKPGYSVFDLIKKLHPTPALGGVPTETALAFMREHELLDRGWYGAPIGWLDSNDISEFAVALRSGLVQANEVSLFAGCGIMRDSDPEMEFAETKMKFLPMLQVLEESDESY